MSLALSRALTLPNAQTLDFLEKKTSAADGLVRVFGSFGLPEKRYGKFEVLRGHGIL